MNDTWWQLLRERGISGEGGHTLVETVAALALLIAVLTPASGAAVQLLIRDWAAEEAEALRLAERAVEEALVAERPRSRAWRPEGVQWGVVQDVRRRKDLYLVEVKVYRTRSRAQFNRSVAMGKEGGNEERNEEKRIAPTVTLRATRSLDAQ